MASAFRDTLAFFYDLGVYDVILPFLLIFTIVFAILEKSKIFGTEKSGDHEYTKKNLNAMVAFVSSFLVVGSSQLVAIINEAIAHIMLLLVLSVFFLILAGSFQKDEEFYLKKGWNKAFMWIMFIGVVLIFLNALGWLQYLYGFTNLNWSSTTTSSVILLVIVIGLMVYITRDPNKGKEEE